MGKCLNNLSAAAMVMMGRWRCSMLGRGRWRRVQMPPARAYVEQPPHKAGAAREGKRRGFAWRDRCAQRSQQPASDHWPARFPFSVPACVRWKNRTGIYVWHATCTQQVNSFPRHSTPVRAHLPRASLCARFPATPAGLSFRIPQSARHRDSTSICFAALAPVGSVSIVRRVWSLQFT